MTDQELDIIHVVDPELEKEREEKKRKAREQKLNQPSIDHLAPKGLKSEELSEVDPTKGPRTFVSETARALEEQED